VHPRGRVLVDDGGLGRLVVAVRGQVRDHQVAAGRHRRHERGGDAARIVGVGHEVQDRDQQNRDRLIEAEHRADPRVPGDRVRIAQVAVDDRGAGHPMQHVARVRDDHRVVVDVHHAAVRRLRARHLVHVAHRRQAGPDVEELPDPEVAGEVADGPPEEEPVLQRAAADHVLADGLEGPL